MYRPLLTVLSVLVLAGLPLQAEAQQRIGYIDSERILDQTPEYASVQQQLDQLEQEWQAELREKEEEIDELYREFEARELLYTDEERQQKRQEIAEAEREKEQLRNQYFGPDGQLYQRQRELMRPIQENILEAVEEVARAEGYDFVFDKSGEFLFMFAEEEYDLTDQVLRRLGLDEEEATP